VLGGGCPSARFNAYQGEKRSNQQLKQLIAAMDGYRCRAAAVDRNVEGVIATYGARMVGFWLVR
jgi:hypothetical protein